VEGRSVGFFIGSALGGVLVDKLGRFSNLIVAVAIDLMAAFTATVPWMPSTNLIFAVSICAGTCEGVTNIGILIVLLASTPCSYDKHTRN